MLTRSCTGWKGIKTYVYINGYLPCAWLTQSLDDGFLSIWLKHRTPEYTRGVETTAGNIDGFSHKCICYLQGEHHSQSTVNLVADLLKAATHKLDACQTKMHREHGGAMIWIEPKWFMVFVVCLCPLQPAKLPHSPESIWGFVQGRSIPFAGQQNRIHLSK